METKNATLTGVVVTVLVVAAVAFTGAYFWNKGQQSAAKATT